MDEKREDPEPKDKRWPRDIQSMRDNYDALSNEQEQLWKRLDEISAEKSQLLKLMGEWFGFVSDADPKE
jgi:uncharacterized coiled-coil DUF342 family protein